jgi:hypothetical protein
MKLFQDKKKYILDTNVFRHATETGDQEDIKKPRKAAKEFWTMTKKEVEDGKASLYTPSETIRELEVQSFTLKESVKSKIEQMIQIQKILPNATNIEIEHQIRKIQAFIRSKYQINIKEELSLGKKGMQYGGVSDARVLYSAWKKEGILVTANIRDFVLYPLLFGPTDKVLYDLLSNQFVILSLPLFNTIANDDTFVEMRKELEEM